MLSIDDVSSPGAAADDRAGREPAPPADRNGRRSLFLSAAAAAAALGGAAPALAASEYPEFDAIRDELAGGGTGGLRRIKEKLVAPAAADYADLLEFTKLWDLEFRKAVLTAARKAMPKGPDRDNAVLVANAVTFDLIGINKALRKVGSEDLDEARRWSNVLVDDINAFLALEPKGPRPAPEKK